MDKVAKGLAGLAPVRGHPLRGRVIFMESHDTAPSDRYGRLPAAVFNGKAFITSMGDCTDADGFQRAGGEVYSHPDPKDVVADAFSWRRAALGMLLLFTSPGVPMLLQGQETFDCSPFSWPIGPGLQWDYMEDKSGPRALFFALVKDLLRLRLGSLAEPLGPLSGDGLYVFHAHNGVIAYLRWNEYDSSSSSQDLALIVINCRCDVFSSYELGVPPSKTWEYVFSTDAYAAGQAVPVVGTQISVCEGLPKHGFPSTVALALPSYSGVVLHRAS
jgi:1,4-alpha-glucan branching enzyme